MPRLSGYQRYLSNARDNFLLRCRLVLPRLGITKHLTTTGLLVLWSFEVRLSLSVAFRACVRFPVIRAAAQSLNSSRSSCIYSQERLILPSAHQANLYLESQRLCGTAVIARTFRVIEQTLSLFLRELITRTTRSKSSLRYPFHYTDIFQESSS